MERIAAIDAWQKSQGSPLRAIVEANSRQRPAPLARLPGVARTPPGLSPLQRARAEELAALTQEFAEAVAEMRTQPRDPAETVRVFDEFQEANRAAIQDQRSLRWQLSVESAARARAGNGRPVPNDPEEARRFGLVQQMKARQAADNRLAPAERIAAFDRAAATYPPLRNSLRPAPAASFPSTQ